jgi:NAD(P)-dependent dehydrogenase (short-subunit alcohol dehydrogenase family)
MASLQGRHALVTGGGRGIGRAIVEAFAGEGAKVTVLGRNERVLKEMLRDGTIECYAVTDVTDEREMANEFARVADQAGPIDILVANAGGAESAPFAKAGADQFRRMFDLNVMGVVHSIRGVLDSMVERNAGRIVAIASTAGLKGYGYVSAYCAAKHAVVGLVRSLAVETAKTGVTVNAVCPGYTDTELVRESLDRIAERTGRGRETALASMLKDNPQGRLVQPQEVAAAVLYLCSPEAAAVTGTTLVVAGGEV